MELEKWELLSSKTILVENSQFFKAVQIVSLIKFLKVQWFPKREPSSKICRARACSLELIIVPFSDPKLRNKTDLYKSLNNMYGSSNLVQSARSGRLCFLFIVTISNAAESLRCCYFTLPSVYSGLVLCTVSCSPPEHQPQRMHIPSFLLQTKRPETAASFQGIFLFLLIRWPRFLQWPHKITRLSFDEFFN